MIWKEKEWQGYREVGKKRREEAEGRVVRSESPQRPLLGARRRRFLLPAIMLPESLRSKS